MNDKPPYFKRLRYDLAYDVTPQFIIAFKALYWAIRGKNICEELMRDMEKRIDKWKTEELKR